MGVSNKIFIKIYFDGYCMNSIMLRQAFYRQENIYEL